MCQVFNAEGLIIYDEPFRPYDLGPVIATKDLVIDPEHSDITRIYLRNGRVLLPSSDFDRHKALLDDINQKLR